MKKVAVFDNAGAGKSTLSKKLAEIIELPLYALDKIQYKAGGEKVEYQDYRQIHDRILNSDTWIIDGYGCWETLWQRLANLHSASEQFIEQRMQDENFSAEDRQDYQIVLSAYQEYLEGGRDYWNKFTTLTEIKK